MANYLRSGFRGTCTSPGSGTGPYTSIAAVAGYRSFATLTDGDTILVGVRSATTWGETGVYTKSGGATPTLTRTRIDETINGNTSPVDWTAGTPLIIYSTLNGVDTASLLGANTWQQDQSFNGKKLRLSPDGNTYIDAQTNTAYEVIVGNAAHSIFYKGGGGENIAQVQWADNGAAPGPLVLLDRLSTSPSVNDLMGMVQYTGRNSGGVPIVYAQIIGKIRDPTAGTEDGGIEFHVQRANVNTVVAELNDHVLAVFPQFQEVASSLLVGKSVGAISDVGAEVRSDGVGVLTAANQSVLLLNRTGSNGSLISAFRDAVFKGSIDVNATTGKLTFSGGTLAHFTDRQGTEADPPLGTVMCSAEEMRDDNHPMARVSTESGDPTVWGVCTGRDERGNLQIDAVGLSKIRVVGPCQNGDLLMSSNRPGVAQRQPDDILRSKTVAKALASVPRGQEALIPCTLLAG